MVRRRRSRVTPDLLLQAYRAGVFPMAEQHDSADLFWLDPEQRGILPLDGFHVPRRLLRTVLSDRFSVRIDTDFAATLAGCAAPTATRPETWINEEIATLYAALHEMGHAHSVESWQGSVLVGGLYGIAIGGAFFGESMFSRATDASKTALAHLVARLKLGGFTLLDTQFVNQHLVQFGAIEIPRIEYHNQLAAALDTAAV